MKQQEKEKLMAAQSQVAKEWKDPGTKSSGVVLSASSSRTGKVTQGDWDQNSGYIPV